MKIMKKFLWFLFLFQLSLFGQQQDDKVIINVESLLQYYETSAFTLKDIFYTLQQDSQNSLNVLLSNYLMLLMIQEGNMNCPDGGSVSAYMDNDIKVIHYYSCSFDNGDVTVNGALRGKVVDDNGNYTPEEFYIHAQNLQWKLHLTKVTFNIDVDDAMIHVTEQNGHDLLPFDIRHLKKIDPYDIDMQANVDLTNIKLDVTDNSSQKTQHFTLPRVYGKMKMHLYDRDDTDSKVFDHLDLHIDPGFIYRSVSKKGEFPLILHDGLDLNVDTNGTDLPCINTNLTDYISGTYKIDADHMEINGAQTDVHSHGSFIWKNDNDDLSPNYMELIIKQGSFLHFVNAFGSHKEFNITGEKLCAGLDGNGTNHEIYNDPGNDEKPLNFTLTIDKGPVLTKFSDMHFQYTLLFDKFKVHFDDKNSTTDDMAEGSMDGVFWVQDNLNLPMPNRFEFQTTDPFVYKDGSMAPFSGSYKINDAQLTAYEKDGVGMIALKRNGETLYDGLWGRIYEKSDIFNRLSINNLTPDGGKVIGNLNLLYYYIECGEGATKCSLYRHPNESITLHAVPKSGYAIDKWGGDCAQCQNDSECTVAFDENRECAIAFKRAEKAVTVPLFNKPILLLLSLAYLILMIGFVKFGRYR